MPTSSGRTAAKATKVAAAVAAAASIGGMILSHQAPAGADPRAVLVGVGSDTTQDVIGGLAGVGINPTIPVIGGVRVLASFDAAIVTGGVIQKGTCITPKPGAPTFDRPNGSTNGRKALSRSIDSTPFTVTGSTCPTPGGSLLGGVVDFARSSAGPASGSGAGPLMYIPFGRDALSFAYAAPALPNDPATSLPRNPVTTLTSTQLNSLFTSNTGTSTIVQNAQGLDVEIVPCSIQTGSGTYSAWNADLGALTATQMANATSLCRTGGITPPAAPGELQENDGNGLRTRADNFPGKQVIIGFSAANFVAQSNGVAVSQLTLGGVDLGAIDALGKPYTGTGSALSPSTSFYSNTTYGRTVYDVVQGSKITGPGNNDLKLMFAQTALGTPALCTGSAQTTVNSFGFLSIPGTGAGTCGDTSLTGPSISGNGSL